MCKSVWKDARNGNNRLKRRFSHHGNNILFTDEKLFTVQQKYIKMTEYGKKPVNQ